MLPRLLLPQPSAPARRRSVHLLGKRRREAGRLAGPGDNAWGQSTIPSPASQPLAGRARTSNVPTLHAHACTCLATFLPTSPPPHLVPYPPTLYMQTDRRPSAPARLQSVHRTRKRRRGARGLTARRTCRYAPSKSRSMSPALQAEDE